MDIIRHPLGKITLVTFALIAFAIALATPAYAADGAVVTEISTQQLVTIGIGVIAPIVIGLITKVSTSATVKAVLLAAVAALVGVGQGFIDTPSGTPWVWQVAVFNGVLAYVVAVSTYFGLIKPTGVSDAAQRSLVKDKPDN